MNLMIIGNNVDELAKDVWLANTNYTILNKCYDITSEYLIKYMNRKKVIITTDSKQFEKMEINTFIDYVTKQNFTPVFIADNKKCFESLMYDNVNELLPNSLLYVRNEENKDYDELVKILKDYLLGKGIVKNDKSIRPSSKRKKRTTKE